MNSGAIRDHTIPAGYTESHRLYYRLRRQRYVEAGSLAGGADAAGQQALTHELAERDEKIAKLETDVKGLRDLALRARAELDNARKRFRREKTETVKYANEGLLRELIGTVDNLERAVQSAQANSESKALQQGVQMVLDQFLGICQGKGLDVIASDGQHFDPHYHEAVSAEERSDVEDNLILETLQKGYILNGRVVRPAMVRVARRVEAPAAEEEPEAAEPVVAAEEEPEAAEPVVVVGEDSEETVADLDDTQPITPPGKPGAAAAEDDTQPIEPLSKRIANDAEAETPVAEETETPPDDQQTAEPAAEPKREPPPTEDET